jgi:hypothetical protein
VALVTQAINELNIDAKIPAAPCAIYSGAKNELITADQYREGYMEETARVHARYDELLVNNARDFDDLLCTQR